MFKVKERYGKFYIQYKWFIFWRYYIEKFVDANGDNFYTQKIYQTEREALDKIKTL